MQIFNITTTDGICSGFSNLEVPKDDGLYIGLTKHQAVVHANFTNYFPESQRGGGDARNCTLDLVGVAKSCNRRSEEVGTPSSETNLSDV
jgi:hypothetical protein